MTCECGAIVPNHVTRCIECRKYEAERLSESTIVPKRGRPKTEFDKEAFNLILREG